MTLKVYVYPGGATGHVAWRFGEDYISFHPGEKISDLGSMELPLPGGATKCRVYAHELKLGQEDHDRKVYSADKHHPADIELIGMNEEAAAAFTLDLVRQRLPYILWDNVHDVGAINCVTTSMMIFNVALPDRWPQDWDRAWGQVFRELRALSAQGGDWISEVIRNPVPGLMYVDQFHQMVVDWSGVTTSSG